MKLLLVTVLAVYCGQLQAGPLASSRDVVTLADSRGLFFEEFNNLLSGIAKEALESLSALGQNTGDQLQSVEDAIEDLEKVYNEKVLKEIEKYDGALSELEKKVSPCFAPVSPAIHDIVAGAREKAGECASDTLAHVKLIEGNIQVHINGALGRVKEIVAIGHKCLAENGWIADQINCALQNAPKAVSIVEEIVKDAVRLIGRTSREVAALASDTEQCLAVTVQDAVAQFNDALEKVVECLGQEDGQSDVLQLEHV